MGISFATIFRRFILLCLLMLALFIIWSAYIYITAPVAQLRGVVTYTPPYKHYTRQAGLGLPDNLALKDIPLELVMETLSGEDLGFVMHYGINPNSVYRNVKQYWKYGGHLAGGSTLTQQVVKNVFTGADRTLYRKYVEMLYALKMETLFTKEEIFTLYANIAQVGHNSYGFQQAAREYFGKEVSQLTPVEGSFIVGNLPSPRNRTYWFKGSFTDYTAYGRTWYMLRKGLELKESFVWGPDVIDTSVLFSYYMRTPGRGVCISNALQDEIVRYAFNQAKAFVILYGNGKAQMLPPFNHK